MEARTLTIQERGKTGRGAVRPSDFQVRDGGAIDPQIVLREPNLSLYCLDFEQRQALFVETPQETDLSLAPFLYQAQYAAARRLLQVPFETLHRLAAEVVIDPQRLILIYSIGRCGSTLVSRAFREIEGVDSISEPDVFTQMLFTWGASDLDGAEKAELWKSCTLLQCAPGKIRHATAWALKFRSEVTNLWPLFYAIFPEAKVIFLYRSARTWARSFLRMIGVDDPAAPLPVGFLRAFLGRTIPRFEGQETISALELAAQVWLCIVEQCLEMQRKGIAIFVTRYEELNAAPRKVLAQMFAYCDLAANAVTNLDTVLEQDSQEGSPLSRARMAEASVPWSQEHMDEIDRLIRESSQGLTADTILPGTYFP